MAVNGISVLEGFYEGVNFLQRQESPWLVCIRKALKSSFSIQLAGGNGKTL
jgi:hypothetical protein